MSLVEHLANISGFNRETWELAAPFFSRRAVAKDQFLVQQDAVCNEVYFVEKGLFRLFYQMEGQERIMLFFKENQFAADYFSFLTRTPSIRPIQAIEDSLVLAIHRDSLEKLYRASPAWERVGRLLAEQAYVQSVLRANRLIHDDQDTRFETFMAEFPDLLQRVPQYMIASYLNMAPETFSRIKRRRMSETPTRPSVHQRGDFSGFS